MEDDKEVELYAAQANAWVNTKFEHDKSLLTLSASGIGLLITIVIATGASSIAVVLLYSFALVAFIISLVSLLWIFKRNATYLEKTIHGHDQSDPLLSILDNIALGAFLVGVLLSSIIGITSAAESFIKKEQEMTEKHKSNNGVPVYDSVNGINNLRSSEGQASINNINNLRQENKQPSSPAPAQAPTPATNKTEDRGQ
jgi:hypothetical protein